MPLQLLNCLDGTAGLGAWGDLRRGGVGLPTRAMIELERYIEGLEVSQGAGVGAALALLPWERRFLRRAFRPAVQTAALTVARGNGKSTLAAAIAAAAVDGPLVQSVGPKRSLSRVRSQQGRDAIRARERRSLIRFF